jgi:hypothetical protein
MFSSALVVVNQQLDETVTKAEKVISAMEKATIVHNSYKDTLAAQEPQLAGYLNQLDNIVKAYLTTKDAIAKTQLSFELQKAFDMLNKAGFKDYIDMNKWIADVQKQLGIGSKKKGLVKNGPAKGSSGSGSSSSGASSSGIVL